MQGLPLNVAHIILDWVPSILFSDFKAGVENNFYTSCGDISGFFQTDADTNVHP